jgi:hypothetical protein
MACDAAREGYVMTRMTKCVWLHGGAGVGVIGCGLVEQDADTVGVGFLLIVAAWIARYVERQMQ